MSGMQIGFIMFGILMMLLVVRIPIGIAMFLVGAGGYVVPGLAVSRRC
jgi:C4-dicarboxylate transporter DctM subunit